jgi:hypothetical protein
MGSIHPGNYLWPERIVNVFLKSFSKTNISDGGIALGREASVDEDTCSNPFQIGLTLALNMVSETKSLFM